jgi:hypothetical protein
LRIKKYKSFLNIDKEKYTQTLKEIVLWVDFFNPRL